MSQIECHDFEGLLYDFADNLLDEDASSRVRAHCSSCSDCNSIVEEIRAVTSLAGSLEEVEPPAEKMWAVVAQRISAESETDTVQPDGFWTVLSFRFRRMRHMFLPALVTALVLFGIFPAWFEDGSSTMIHRRGTVSNVPADRIVSVEDCVDNAISDASSQARWDLLDNAFSDMALDDVTTNLYSDWEGAGQ